MPWTFVEVPDDHGNNRLMPLNPYEVTASEKPPAKPVGRTVWARIRFTLAHIAIGALTLALLLAGWVLFLLPPHAPERLLAMYLTEATGFGFSFGGLTGWIVGSFRWERRERRLRDAASAAVLRSGAQSSAE